VNVYPYPPTPSYPLPDGLDLTIKDPCYCEGNCREPVHRYVCQLVAQPQNIKWAPNQASPGLIVRLEGQDTKKSIVAGVRHWAGNGRLYFYQNDDLTLEKVRKALIPGTKVNVYPYPPTPGGGGGGGAVPVSPPPTPTTYQCNSDANRELYVPGQNGWTDSKGNKGYCSENYACTATEAKFSPNDLCQPTWRCESTHGTTNGCMSLVDGSTKDKTCCSNHQQCNPNMHPVYLHPGLCS